jgi:hypothetical protein
MSKLLKWVLAIFLSCSITRADTILINPYSLYTAPFVYLINENFEGAGTPANWFTSGGSFDYTPALIGTESAYIDASGTSYVTPLNTVFLNNTELWGKFRVKFLAFPAPYSVWTFANAAYDGIGGFVVNTSGNLQIANGNMTATPATNLSIGTEYWVYWYWKKSTSTSTPFNGIAKVGFTTSTEVRPISGTNYAQVINGDAITNMTGFAMINTNGCSAIIDNVQVSDQAFD